MKLFKKDLTVGQTIFKYLIGFVVLMLAVLWIMQVVMLDEIHTFLKRNEIEKVSSTIAENIENDELSQMLEYIDEQKGISIVVLDKEFNAVASSDGFFEETLMHGRDSGFYDKLYESAKNSGGVSVEISRPSPSRFGGGGERGGEYNRIVKEHPVMRPREIENILYVQIASSSDGEEYLILNSSAVSPVDSTVETLRVSLVFVGILLILFITIIAFLISRRVTKPISRMNDSAKILATGNYDIKFKGDGFREIKELGDTLNFAASELSKSDELRRELMANVSHDLRTPLTMITGFAEVMKDIPGENTGENIQIIIDESKRLTELVNDMMDISKLQSGTAELQLSKVNITDLITEILERFSGFCNTNGYKISFLYNEKAEVVCDRIKIGQVMYNLINNAIQYSGDEKNITVLQTASENSVRIDVEDRGEGIGNEDIPYIWDRYFKSKAALKRAKTGTGLGLSIVKGILELHNAKYGVESKIGEGSDFWFELKK